jgi:hypothetical protein
MSVAFTTTPNEHSQSVNKYDRMSMATKDRIKRMNTREAKESALGFNWTMTLQTLYWNFELHVKYLGHLRDRISRA